MEASPKERSSLRGYLFGSGTITIYLSLPKEQQVEASKIFQKSETFSKILKIVLGASCDFVSRFSFDASGAAPQPEIPVQRAVAARVETGDNSKQPEYLVV
jgi:hypothetical protein